MTVPYLTASSEVAKPMRCIDCRQISSLWVTVYPDFVVCLSCYLERRDRMLTSG